MLTLYSKDNCTQCLQLESLLKVKGKTYEVKKLDKDYTREDLQSVFEQAGLPVPRSFPMLFNGSTYVGTLNEAKLALATGKL